MMVGGNTEEESESENETKTATRGGIDELIPHHSPR